MVENHVLESTGEIGGNAVMEVIEMRQSNIETGIGHSSKGNQLKWEQDGWWYKADAFGFESLAEVVVSRLLLQSSIPQTVLYEPIVIRYHNKEYRGCRSRNFRGEKEELIPLERLVRSYSGFGLAKQMARMTDTKARISYVEELVKTVTGMEDFGEYLVKLLEIDAFFLNEDRHTNNIAILYNKETKYYRICPFFDMGLSLFSDTRDMYPWEMDFMERRKCIQAKPFDSDFDEQMDAAEALFGSYLKFLFPKEKITKVIEELRQELLLSEEDVCLGKKGGYTQQEFLRVEETLRYQAAKYQYMFC